MFDVLHRTEKSKMLKVSVILTTHKRDLARKALQSLLDQTHQDFEIFVMMTGDELSFLIQNSSTILVYDGSDLIILKSFNQRYVGMQKKSIMLYLR